MLRAECHRVGIRDLSIVGGQARLSPISLSVSEELRLKRISRDAIIKADAQQLVIGIPRQKTPASFLSGLLGELRPAPTHD